MGHKVSARSKEEEGGITALGKFPTPVVPENSIGLQYQ
jgi:hypothetical protein